MDKPGGEPQSRSQRASPGRKERGEKKGEFGARSRREKREMLGMEGHETRSYHGEAGAGLRSKRSSCCCSCPALPATFIAREVLTPPGWKEVFLELKGAELLFLSIPKKKFGIKSRPGSLVQRCVMGFFWVFFKFFFKGF